MDHADVVLAKAAAIAAEANQKKNEKRIGKKPYGKGLKTFHHQPAVQVLPLQKPPPKILEIKHPESKELILQAPPAVDEPKVEQKADVEQQVVTPKVQQEIVASPKVEIQKIGAQKVSFKKADTAKTDGAKKAETPKKNDQKKPAEAKKPKAKKNGKKAEQKKASEENPQEEQPTAESPQQPAEEKAEVVGAKDEVNPKKLDQQKKVVAATPQKTLRERFQEIKVDVVLANTGALDEAEKKPHEAEDAQDGRTTRLSNRPKEAKKNKKASVAKKKIADQTQQSPGSESSFEMIPLTDDKKELGEPKPKLADNNNDDKQEKSAVIEEVAAKTEAARPPVAAVRSKIAAAKAALAANSDAAAQPPVPPKKPGKLASLRNFFESIGNKKNSNEEEGAVEGEQKEAVNAVDSKTNVEVKA